MIENTSSWKKNKAEKPLGKISAMWNFRKFSLWIYSVEDF